MLILAIVVGMAIVSYVSAAPDEKTLRASRGVLGGLRSGVSSGTRALRSEWGSTRSSGGSPVPSTRGGTGKKTKGSGTGGTQGSTGSSTPLSTSGGTRSARLRAATRTGYRRTRAVARAVRTGYRGARQGYRDRAQRAVERREEKRQSHPDRIVLSTWWRLPAWVPRRSSRTLSQDRKTAEEDPSEDPSASTPEPAPSTSSSEPTKETAVSGEYASPSDLSADVDLAASLAEEAEAARNAADAAQMRLNEHLASMRSSYGASEWSTGGVTAAFVNLDEADNAPMNVLEVLPSMREEVAKAEELGEHSGEIEAQGDIKAFQNS